MSELVASKSRATRVLLVTNDFGPRAGGIETFIIGLLEGLKKCEVIVYTSNQEKSDLYDESWLRDFGVRVIRDRTKILLPTPRVILKLRKLIKNNGFEVIWFGAAAPLGIAAKWLRISQVKRIIALTHGHEVWWSKLPPFSWLLKFAGKNIDYFGYLGAYTANQISRVVPDHKLIKIAPGIDTKHFRRRKTNLKRTLNLENSPTIVSVGRLVHRKGQDRLIQALHKIKREIPDVKLLLVGEGPYKHELERITKQLDLSDSVRFVGKVNYSKLPDYLSVGDLFAMPARSRLFGLEVEGLGIVYLEAASCGLPVIVGNSGGAPDTVINEKTGFVVDGNNIDEIVRRATFLLKNRNIRQKMGAAGVKFAFEEWRLQIWSERFNQLIKGKA